MLFFFYQVIIKISLLLPTSDLDGTKETALEKSPLNIQNCCCFLIAQIVLAFLSLCSSIALLRPLGEIECYSLKVRQSSQRLVGTVLLWRRGDFPFSLKPFQKALSQPDLLANRRSCLQKLEKGQCWLRRGQEQYFILTVRDRADCIICVQDYQDMEIMRERFNFNHSSN